MHLSPNRPHHLASEGEENGVYVRIGSTNRTADSAPIAEMRRSSRYESFDELPLAELNSEALDFRVASELFRPHQDIHRRDFQSLGLVTKHKVRNRVIARIFRELGYIEQWGSGIQRMTNAGIDAGLSESELLEIAGRFRLTLRFAKVGLTAKDNLDYQV